jgi:hypothetical protein
MVQRIGDHAMKDALEQIVAAVTRPVSNTIAANIVAIVLAVWLKNPGVMESKLAKTLYLLGQVMFLGSIALALYAYLEIYLNLESDPGRPYASGVLQAAQGGFVVGVALVVVALLVAFTLRSRSSMPPPT